MRTVEATSTCLINAIFQARLMSARSRADAWFPLDDGTPNIIDSKLATTVEINVNNKINKPNA